MVYAFLPTIVEWLKKVVLLTLSALLHTWLMAVYNTLLLRGSGDTEETLLATLRAEITKAEQDGWQLVEIFEYTGEPTAFMKRLQK